MRQRIAAVVAVLIIGLWLVNAVMAAQGRGQGGRPGGAPGMSGAQAPMGMPGSQNPGARGSGNPQGATPNTAVGPKSATTLLEQNTKLANNLATFFPEGTDLATQASGFKNLGEFVSAVHVSHNLTIPFDNLKCTELGTTKATASGMTCPPTVTNTDGMSLGKAIQSLKSGADAQQAVRDANRQAQRDIEAGKS